MVDAAVEALVGERVIARGTTGANGGYSLAVPARTPFALRTHRPGFADDLIELDGTDSNISRDVTLSIGALSDTLVVTASRSPESRTSVTQSLSVVSRPDVQALGATELSDVLRFIPGTSVEGTGREGGGPTSLFVRGGDSDYNVVLIDGVLPTSMAAASTSAGSPPGNRACRSPAGEPSRRSGAQTP